MNETGGNPLPAPRSDPSRHRANTPPARRDRNAAAADLRCAACDKVMRRSSRSLPPGKATCRECRTGEAPAGAKEDIRSAAATGERTRALVALRDRLAADLDECRSARDVSSLAQRLMDVLAQIDDLGGGTKPKPKETGLSEFEKRLRDREASNPRRTKRSG